MPEGQTMGSRRRSLTVRINATIPFSNLPVALHARRLPMVSPVGDYSLHPSFAPVS